MHVFERDLAEAQVLNATLTTKLVATETELQHLQANADSIESVHALAIEALRSEYQAKLDALELQRQKAMDAVSALLHIADASEVAAFSDSQAKVEAEKICRSEAGRRSPHMATCCHKRDGGGNCGSRSHDRKTTGSDW